MNGTWSLSFKLFDGVEHVPLRTGDVDCLHPLLLECINEFLASHQPSQKLEEEAAEGPNVIPSRYVAILDVAFRGPVSWHGWDLLVGDVRPALVTMHIRHAKVRNHKDTPIVIA